MTTEIQLDQEKYAFSSYRVDNIIVLKIKDTFLLRISDLKTKAMILDYLKLISKTGSIKVMVILGSPLERQTKDYLGFYRQLSKWIADQGSIHRIYNAIDQFILTLREINQIIIHADRRKAISTFLNWSFACDYRIVSYNATIHNSHLEMGLIPKGGSAFFLSKLMGTGKAFEILLSDENISANRALELNMVNQIASTDQLEEAAMNTARRFARPPISTLSGMKHLINHTMQDLEDYLSFENDELYRIVNQPDFQNRLIAYYHEKLC